FPSSQWANRDRVESEWNRSLPGSRNPSLPNCVVRTRSTASQFLLMTLGNQESIERETPKGVERPAVVSPNIHSSQGLNGDRVESAPTRITESVATESRGRDAFHRVPISPDDARESGINRKEDLERV